MSIGSDDLGRAAFQHVSTTSKETHRLRIPLGKLLITGAVALASVTPAAATAASGHAGPHAQQHVASHGKAKGKGKAHNVSYVFKGTWNAASGTVTVKHGNAHVRKAGLVGKDVKFDLTGSKLVVADTNADGSITAADLADGDRVVVKARLPRKDPGPQPFKAKMVVDQTGTA
jgi:hypothetical protein